MGGAHWWTGFLFVCEFAQVYTSPDRQASRTPSVDEKEKERNCLSYHPGHDCSWRFTAEPRPVCLALSLVLSSRQKIKKWVGCSTPRTYQKWQVASLADSVGHVLDTTVVQVQIGPHERLG